MDCFEIIAHRGYATDAPENTIASCSSKQSDSEKKLKNKE
jgi:hypothetical protein